LIRLYNAAFWFPRQGRRYAFHTAISAIIMPYLGITANGVPRHGTLAWLDRPSPRVTLCPMGRIPEGDNVGDNPPTNVSDNPPINVGDHG
jgi:hypothetical protein